MIKVIESGKKEFFATCSKCGCRFSYELEDLCGGCGIYCPECGAYCSHLVQKTDLTPPFGTTKDSITVEELNKSYPLCEHEWEMDTCLTTSGQQYHFRKCGATKIEPFKFNSYEITY